MSDPCQDAKADLANAEHRQRGATAWVDAANAEVHAAELVDREAVYDHERSVDGAKAFDAETFSRQRVVDDAKAILRDAEANYHEMNREARLNGLAADVNHAEAELSDASDKSRSAWHNVTVRAQDAEHARTALRTAQNKLSLAHDEAREVDTWLNNAQRAVQNACG